MSSEANKVPDLHQVPQGLWGGWGNGFGRVFVYREGAGCDFCGHLDAETGEVLTPVVWYSAGGFAAPVAHIAPVYADKGKRNLAFSDLSGLAIFPKGGP